MKLNKETILNDSLSSITVLLVALPVSLGVAVASGLPPVYGIFTAIIGGLIVTLLSGSPLQISGPSTGLAVMVLHVVQTYGAASLIPLALIVGIFQIVVALLKWGHLFQATPPSLVKAMLSGIGFLIIISQVYILFGFELSSESYLNIVNLLAYFIDLINAPLNISLVENVGVAGIVFTAMALWPKVKNQKLQKIPASIVGIAIASVIATVFGWDIAHVSLPHDLFSSFSNIDYSGAFQSINLSFVLYAIGFAFVASVETMLCVSALDQITHRDSSYNKTILAQGVGNIFAGLIGTIPVVGVISRSAANIEAESRTRLAAFLQAFWMLLILFIPFVVEYIPQAALLGLLLYIGIKLLDPLHIFDYIKNYNKTSIIFFVTFILTISVDLLIGVVAGFLVAIFILLFDVLKYDLKVEDRKGNKVLKFTGKLSFLDLPVLNKELLEHTDSNPTNFEVCLREVQYLDPAIHKKFESLKKKLEEQGHSVEIKK